MNTMGKNTLLDTDDANPINPIERDLRADEWKCYRCELVLPSPSDGLPPHACLKELGGCGRSDDWDDENGYTRFFPADWHPDKIALYVDADLNPGQRIFDRLVSMWDHYIEFSDQRWHPRLLSLFALEAYFYRLLPAVFYVGMTGPSGSAKTAILEILKMVSPNPVMTWNASIAALARKLDEGCTALIEEVDKMDNEKRDLIQGAARTGYRPGNVYLRYDYKKKSYEEVNVYGPKAFSFITTIEDALRTRTIEIATVRVKDDPFRRVLDNLGRPLDPLPNAIRRDLEAFCDERAKEWTPEKVHETLMDPKFRDRVKAAISDGAMPRDIELAAIALLAAEIAGVDIAAEVKSAIASQAIFENEELSEIVNYVKDNFPPTQERYVRLLAIRDGVNKARKETGERPIHHKRFRALLREAGLREGEELKRLPKSGQHILVWTPHALKSLGLDGSPDASHTGHGWFTPALDASPADGGVKDKEEKVKNREERVKKLCEVSRALSGGEKRSFTREEFSEAASKIGISSYDALKWLDKWVQDGEAYSPSAGRYRMVTPL